MSEVKPGSKAAPVVVTRTRNPHSGEAGAVVAAALGLTARDAAPVVATRGRKPLVDEVAVDAQLGRAKQAAAAMGQMTEAMNATIARAEQAFTALGLGVSAAVPLDPDDESEGWEQLLRFGKQGNQWRLFLESGPPGGEPTEWSATPLQNTSRETRVLAMERLPALWEALVQEAEQQVQRLSVRTLGVDQLLARLERAK